MHAKKTLLFHDNLPWQKTNPPHDFDVTMGSYDGAETCELIGLYILNKINHIIDYKDVGLYRDDGLAVLRNHSLTEANRKAKEITQIFHGLELKVTTEINNKCAHFLDVTFNLKNGSYRPFTKLNNISTYVNKTSNHPKNIIKRIPDTINRRLSDISSDEQQFDAAAQEYQHALQRAGYEHKLKFEKSVTHKRNRNRKIIWFNPPPSSKNVSTNIGRKFLNLIDMHFPRDNKLHEIFNRNNVKISYSCMDNMTNIINAHHKLILKTDEKQKEDLCNCIQPANCPLTGKCLTNNVVYKATVTSNTERPTSKSYIGICETSFKTRYNNHKSSFAIEEKKNTTELSKYIWELKNKKSEFHITWSILKRANAYCNRTKRCQLCLWEKYFIITSDKSSTLNKRNELLNKCRHANKFILKNI